MRFSHKLHIRSAPFQLCLALSARSSLPSLSCACRCRAVGLAFRKGTQHTSTLSLLMRSLFNSSAVSHKTGAWDATFGHHPLSHCCEVASLDGYLGSTPSCLQHTLSETTCHMMTSPPTHHAIWSATFFCLVVDRCRHCSCFIVLSGLITCWSNVTKIHQLRQTNASFDFVAR